MRRLSNVQLMLDYEMTHCNNTLSRTTSNLCSSSSATQLQQQFEVCGLCYTSKFPPKLWSLSLMRVFASFVPVCYRNKGEHLCWTAPIINMITRLPHGITHETDTTSSRKYKSILRSSRCNSYQSVLSSNNVIVIVKYQCAICSEVFHNLFASE